MVGVPGKSKGCGTCRKRKIKCDETRPICKRCEYSKLECDRYDRFPVFIDRNQTGYRKRMPFEEVIPYPAQPQRIYSPEAESVRLLSWFHQSHIKFCSSQSISRAQTHWLSLVECQQTPHPALKAALLAVSFVKWGRVEADLGLRQKGRKYYQTSLKSTQKALTHTQDALSDDILATGCVMTLYELYDPSSSCSDSWLYHMVGAGNLLCLRGPGDFQSADSRVILEHIRYIFMIRCLIARRSCVFGSTQWRQLPWQGKLKPVEQQVYDQGLRLTILLEDCDILSVADEHPLSGTDALLSTCTDIFETLNPLILQISSEIERINASDTTTTTTSLLIITAFGIQIEAATSAHKFLHYLELATSGSAVTTSTTVRDLMFKVHNLLEARRHLARKILWTLETSIKTRLGALDAVRASWALRLAQEQFASTDVEAAQCRAISMSLPQRSSPFDALRLPLDRHTSSPIYRRFP